MAEYKFIEALPDQLPEIVAMLADDVLGSTREKYTLPLPHSYVAAFEAISKDPNQELWVLTIDEKVTGTLQLTMIPYLTYQGSSRALIEAVRVHKDFRGQGLGKVLIEWAIERARIRGAKMVQLTSNSARTDALRFYESLGFDPSHTGFKLFL